jgi:hypothetical protein
MSHHENHPSEPQWPLFGLRCMNVILLPGERLEDIEAMRAEYVDTFKPASQIEECFVEFLIAGHWRILRNRTVWNSFVKRQAELIRTDVGEDYDPDEPDTLNAQAVQNISVALKDIRRYSVRLRKDYLSHLRTLLDIQQPEDVRRPPASERALAEEFLARPFEHRFVVDPIGLAAQADRAPVSKHVN